MVKSRSFFNLLKNYHFKAKNHLKRRGFMKQLYEFDELYPELLKKETSLLNGHISSEAFIEEMNSILDKMQDLHLSTNVSQSNCNLFIKKAKDFLVDKNIKEALFNIKLLSRHIDDDGMGC